MQHRCRSGVRSRKHVADQMSHFSSPVAPDASRDDGEDDLVDACIRKGSESYTPQPQPLVLFHCYDAQPRYDKESYTRQSEIRPPTVPPTTTPKSRPNSTSSPNAITASEKSRIFVLSRGSG